jgi:5'(3')-deoxyribonucleotidase
MNGKCSCIHSYFAGILFTAPHNVHETHYPRVDDCNEVGRRFLA